MTARVRTLFTTQFTPSSNWMTCRSRPASRAFRRPRASRMAWTARRSSGGVKLGRAGRTTVTFTPSRFARDFSLALIPLCRNFFRHLGAESSGGFQESSQVGQQSFRSDGGDRQ